MKILLTNEAGCFTAGIIALAKELNKQHRICIVAPLNPLSNVGHTITTSERPLHAKKWEILNTIKIWSVDGTPCDCITLALDKLLKSKPDLIISGIDHTYGRGETIYCSGVVSAAVEGAIQGVKSIAVSGKIDSNARDKESAYRPIARLIAKKLDEFVSMIPKNGALNINCPEMVDSKKIAVTHLSFGVVDNKYSIETNPFGKTFAWLKNTPVGTDTKILEQKGDVYWTKHGWTTVTPLKLDLINIPAISIIKDAGISVDTDNLPAIRKGDITQYEQAD
jgi:5'-nucleotidase